MSGWWRWCDWCRWWRRWGGAACWRGGASCWRRVPPCCVWRLVAARRGVCRLRLCGRGGQSPFTESLLHFITPKLLPTTPCNCLNYCRLSATRFRVACVRPLLFCSDPMLSSFAYPAPLSFSRHCHPRSAPTLCFLSVLSALCSDASGEGPGLRRNSPGPLSLRLLRSALVLRPDIGYSWA